MNRFLEEDGQGMVEYALIIALIAVACIIAFATLGQKIKGKADKVSGDLAKEPDQLATDGTQPG